jgi:hypothetical protein
MTVKVIIQSISPIQDGVKASGTANIQIISDYLSPVSGFNTVFSVEFKDASTQKDAIVIVLDKVKQLAEQMEAGADSAKKDLGV